MHTFRVYIIRHCIGWNIILTHLRNIIIVTFEKVPIKFKRWNRGWYFFSSLTRWMPRQFYKDCPWRHDEFSIMGCRSLVTPVAFRMLKTRRPVNEQQTFNTSFKISNRNCESSLVALDVGCRCVKSRRFNSPLVGDPFR